MVVLSWTFLFQLINTLLLIGIIYVIYNVVIKQPKRISALEEKIRRLERRFEDEDKR